MTAWCDGPPPPETPPGWLDADTGRPHDDPGPHLELVRSALDVDAIGDDLDDDPRAAEALRGAPAWEGPRSEAQGGAGWPVLRPLTERRSRPEAPLEGLPDEMRDMVEAVAAAVEVPAELPLCFGLGAVSALLLGKRTYQPEPGWIEEAGVYSLVALPSGERKSAGCRLMRAALLEIERRAVEAARPRADEARGEAALLESWIRKLEAEGSKMETRGERQEAARKIGEIRAELRGLQTQARLPRLLIDNATPEAAVIELAEGPRAIIEPEPGALGLAAHGYDSRPPDLAWLLNSYGAEPIRQARVHRARVDVERPLMACAIASQPDAALEFLTDARLEDRGLPGRFLVWCPRPRVGYRSHDRVPIPAGVAERWAGLLERLYELEQTPEPIGLTDEALRMVQAYERELEPLLREGQPLGDQRSHGSKVVGAAVRVAGLVSACSPWEPAGPIDEAAMQTGIRVLRASIEHRLALLSEGGASPELRLASRLLTWARTETRGRFMSREALRAHRAVRREGLSQALELLEERGYVRRLPRETSGPGRPSEAYELRPEVAS